jgi:hypothetical protein
MQNIYAARDAMDAHFLKGLLAEQDIESVIEGEELEEVWGAVPLSETNKPSVWVNEVDVARAKPIIDEYERRKVVRAGGEESAERLTWKCPRCGEQIEEQFTSCWHCNTSRPTAVSCDEPQK